MMLNDREGDCVIAAWGHLRMLHAALLGKPWYLTDAQIQAIYVTITGMEGAAYDPATGANDNGCVELDLLNYVRQAGKIAAFVAVDGRNTDEIKTAIDLFAGVYMGCGLPLTAQSQDVWTVVDPSLQGESAPYSWGGHAMVVVGYDADGVTFVTWGSLKKATWQWWMAYVAPGAGGESYALLTPDLINATSKRDFQGLNMDQLMADLRQFTPPSAKGFPDLEPATANAKKTPETIALKGDKAEGATGSTGATGATGAAENGNAVRAAGAATAGQTGAEGDDQRERKPDKSGTDPAA